MCACVCVSDMWHVTLIGMRAEVGMLARQVRDSEAEINVTFFHDCFLEFYIFI